jgi:hypothetical protein
MHSSTDDPFWPDSADCVYLAIFLTCSQASGQKQAMLHMLYHDALTGLPKAENLNRP